MMALIHDVEILTYNLMQMVIIAWWLMNVDYRLAMLKYV